MVRPPHQGRTQCFRFTPNEVEKMENILKKNNGSSPGRDAADSLAKEFNAASEREGKVPVQTKQILSWFKKRRQTNKAKAGLVPAASDSGAQANSDEAPPGEQALDIPELEFEAKSSKDGAWYDVAIFLTHRLPSSGEPEVFVRYDGFGSEEDEWVNVRKAVRQRSVACEPSECTSINAGDTILCFRERSERAVYFDAHVMDVQRKRHDVRGCRCRFLVRYDNDKEEERVSLRRIYRRPEV